MPLPHHLFASDSDGALYDTRAPNWSEKPVRAPFQRHCRTVESLADVKAALRAGCFTFPGCYRVFAVTRDGAALCFDCMRAEFAQIVYDHLHDVSTGWRIAGFDMEGAETVFCDHCGRAM